jgi:hypothetical protein
MKSEVEGLRMKRLVASGLAILAGASACSGGTEPTSLGQHPDPVVTLSLQNGSTLEYYDLQDRVMVSEYGVADHAPLAPQYLGLSNPVTWSNCTRRYALTYRCPRRSATLRRSILR